MAPAWEIQASFPATKKQPKTIVAHLNSPRPVRQALPAGLKVEKGLKVTEKRISCKGEEPPARQVELIANAFNFLMDIADWKEELDGQISIKCSRAEFNEVIFILGEKKIRAWQQVKATNRHREKLASALFEKKLVISQQLLGEELEYTVVPYASRFRKPKDTRILTRQMLLPGVPAVVRPTVEAIKYWGDPRKEQKELVDGIEDG